LKLSNDPFFVEKARYRGSASYPSDHALVLCGYEKANPMSLERVAGWIDTPGTTRHIM
jgi:hypothetical protein